MREDKEERKLRKSSCKLKILVIHYNVSPKSTLIEIRVFVQNVPGDSSEVLTEL